MTTTFICHLSLPILVGEDRYKYLPFIAVFRGIPFKDVDDWVMLPDGRARSDRELAAEVLVELRWQPGTVHDDGSEPPTFEVADIVQLDRAAAVIVSTFLAALPRA